MRTGQISYHLLLESEPARKAEEELRNRTKSSGHLKGTRMVKDSCEQELFLGLVQIYSEKSVTSVKHTEVSDYPIHTDVMNFSFDAWKKQRARGQTLVA